MLESSRNPSVCDRALILQSLRFIGTGLCLPYHSIPIHTEDDVRSCIYGLQLIRVCWLPWSSDD